MNERDEAASGPTGRPATPWADTPAFSVSNSQCVSPPHRVRRRRFAAVLTSAAAGAGLWLPISAPPADGAEVSYTTPGTHIFTVPEGVTSITFDLFGGDGQRGGVTGTTPNSWAGRATATLPVTSQERIQIVVGGAGGLGTKGNAGAGGFNGGGAGGVAGPNNGGGGGGGGASDIRHGSCSVAGSCGLSERVLIAGGGGGTGAPGPKMATSAGTAAAWRGARLGRHWIHPLTQGS